MCVALRAHLDQGSNTGSTQHCHLARVDAIGPEFPSVVHAQHPVQHVLLLTVARGRDYTVSACAQLQGHYYMNIYTGRD